MTESINENIIKELRELINRNNMDTESDTPDFILAEMMYGFYESYKQTDFKVGDEVQYIKGSDPTTFVVTDIDFTGNLYGIRGDGATMTDKKPSNWKKTGRHFDEVDILLRKLRKSEE